jgi:hypothetical protein
MEEGRSCSVEMKKLVTTTTEIACEVWNATIGKHTVQFRP